jgi:hypothetical protein
VWGYMKNMKYENKAVTRHELLQIFDSARRVHVDAVLRKVTLSSIERDGMCIQADGGHSELSLN